MITILTKAVHKAGRGVVRDFGEIDKLQISKKGVANFVTSADLRTEQILVDELRKARPKFSFLTEESGHIAGPDATKRFVIDPIDGTTNFIHAIPYISISVAVQEKTATGWETTAGVVYDPMHDELFVAEKNNGAYSNTARLRVSNRSDDLLLSTTSPRKSRAGFEVTRQAFTQVMESGATVRCSGSAALDLAYVAAGRLDGIWYHRLNIWDFAAGDLIVREAGGKITAVDGSPVVTDGKGSVLGTNGKIHSALQDILTVK
jgi:myo-inositol-1(or 4)-monophosphatase